MLVAHSFDLWQKDTFFSAAEEVQQSADIMESAYRTWERERKEGLISENSDELCRELQTALGTAKWQLEEFEKAVRLSYRNRDDDFTMARHRQFVDAIENQISRVETALRESFSKQGNQPLRWVNLNKEECDDLAAFLSGMPSSSSLRGNNCMVKEECCSIKAACNMDIPYHSKGSSDVIASNEDAHFVVDIVTTENPKTRDDSNCHSERISGSRRTWSSPNIGPLKIVIDDKDEKKNALLPSIEATPKDKGSRPVFWRQRCGDHLEAKGGMLSYSKLSGIRWINQLMGQVGGSQRPLQTPMHSKLSSARVKLALVLTVFLIVPFVIYST